MKFGDKVRELRTDKKLTQAELGKLVGVTVRTVAGWENDGRYPQKRDLYDKLATVFEVPANYLISEDEEFIADAAERYGVQGERDAKTVLTQAAAVFAGGELSDEDRLAFMTEIQQLYLDSKEIAAEKFTPKKYRKGKK
ncbi:MAG: helix-turn-helix transcriptional regulator [Oscillospiraceae bacterium]|nr:helix-turn-helix transcriptional regulator [Oscillospiraceae bacterium]MDD3227818.1 helix-turn-helix transcriptional regulator [Oscillospiraceae bacterium]